MYAKIVNGQVEAFPYTVSMLRNEHPNTSFPKNVPDELLASYDIYPVRQDLNFPEVDLSTHKVVKATTPTLIGDEWVLGFSIAEKTQEEREFYAEAEDYNNRRIRDQKLAETDWWALPDSPTMTAEQTAYRQALRDITTHSNWPILSEADWPTKP